MAVAGSILGPGSGRHIFLWLRYSLNTLGKHNKLYEFGLLRSLCKFTHAAVASIFRFARFEDPNDNDVIRRRQSLVGNCSLLSSSALSRSLFMSSCLIALLNTLFIQYRDLG